MSLAGQISDTVATLAATRDARHGALGRIRKDTARHLSEAQAARRRMASEQQQRLDEALRSIKLGTAILLGEADERIDRYRKARAQEAARLDRALAEGFAALRGTTRKWLGTQSALRRAETAKALRQRQQDRASLGSEVQRLTSNHLAFLAALSADRRQAASLWLGRASPATALAARAPAKAEPAKVEPAKAEPGKITAAPEAVAEEPVKAGPVAAAPAEAGTAKVDAPRGEPVKTEAAKAEPVKAEPVKAEPVKADAAKTDAGKTDAGKTGGSKPAGDKAPSAKSL